MIRSPFTSTSTRSPSRNRACRAMSSECAVRGYCPSARLGPASGSLFGYTQDINRPSQDQAKTRPLRARKRSMPAQCDIGVVEGDERRIATQFERELLDRAVALL